MLILRHNELSCQDLFIIERKMLKVTELSDEKLNLFNLKIFEHTRPNIYGLILGLFQRLHSCEALGITTSQLLDFIISVDQGYMMNHYHSFFHAADVTIILYHMLCEYDVARYLSRMDMAAVLIAGLCHDIGHPGKNNNFQVNSKSELAGRYSDKSVLESYSCTLTMDLMTTHKLLADIEEASDACSVKTTESEFRTNIIKMILATDMIFHFELQESLNNLVELSDDLSKNNPLASVKDIFTSQGEKSAISYFQNKSYFDDQVPYHLESILPASPEKEQEEQEDQIKEESELTYSIVMDNQNVIFHEPEEIKPFEKENKEFLMGPQHRLLLCEIIVHAADISNPVRPWPLCHAWADLVAEEFFEQGEAEKELGLAVSPNMDRNKISKGIIGIQFSEFIIRPFFEIFSEMFPKASIILKNTQENYDHWVELEKTDNRNRDEEDGGHCYPTSMLPNRPMLNPPGRRVSVAAGMIIIPDQKPSNYLIPRSVSHIDLVEFDQFQRKQKEMQYRRKSEQPVMSLPEVSSRRTPIRQKY